MRRNVKVQIIVVVLLLGTLKLAAVLSSFADAEKKVFRAGAYAQNINPQKYPISVNGGMTDRQATGAHDPLHARCLVLDDGKTKLAFAVCDSCMIPREITDEAKRLASEKTGIPVSNILVSATHTHTAPTVGGVFQSDPDKAYQKYLAKKIAVGIVKANANLEPAKIAWSVAKNPDQVFNRRWLMKAKTINPDPLGGTDDKVRMNPGYEHPGLNKPAGPIDPDVSILAVQSIKGRPIALLANYSLHYVGGVRPLSADYFGAFADRIRQLIGAQKVKPAFVGIMSNGTSADINNINYGGPAPKRRGEYEQIRVVANDVADTAFEAYKKLVYHDWVPLAAATKEITLGVRLPSKADIVRAKKILAEAKAKHKKGTPFVLRTRPQIYARETVLLAKYPPKVKVVLQALRVCDLGICATPCETFVEIGLELKEKSPFEHTFTIELANGYNGYLPTPRQHKLGGYETWRARSSYLAEDASPKVTKTLLGLLKKVDQSK